MTRFSILKSGTPKRSSPPPASSRSKTVTRCPARLSCCAAASPAGPEPTTATERPVRVRGGCGTIQPSSQPRSTIVCSICLIVTALPSSISSTHAASHGAGQRRPVNSGKLFVRWSWSSASRKRSRYTRSFQSGMRFPSGQPLWQNGTPHSMQRAPCARSVASGSGTTNSRWSCTRSAGGRSDVSARAILRNAPSAPITPPPPRSRA